MSDRMYIANGRELVTLIAASGIVISAWALFPSTVESGIYIPLPEASAPASAKVNSARKDVVDRPLAGFTSISAKLLSSTPPMPDSVTVWQPSPVVDVSMVPLRSKLQALLMLLYYQSGDLDPVALEAKIQALLKLPDSVLAQLMQHPDLIELTKMLDGVFLGTSDVSGVKAELDKIDVTSVPAGTSEQIQVVRVSGKLAYAVRTPAGDEGIGNAAVSPVPPPPPPGEPVTLASEFDASAGMSVSAFALAPSSAELPPPPPPPPPPLPAPEPAPEPAAQFAPAIMSAPSIEELPPSLPPPEPTPEAPKPPEEPAGTPQASQDVINSGNKFEPGETAAQQGAENASETNFPETNSPATETAPPSTPATGTEGPAEPGGVTEAGGEAGPSNDEGSGTPSESGTSP